jgi:hypothetical protein
MSSCYVLHLRRAWIGGLFAVGLTGCATAPLPVNYAPSSVLTASGATTVSTFAYLPADKGVVTPNQIRNTAIGNIKIEKDVNAFFRDAVFSELRFVGVKLDNTDRVLSGEIVEFLIDDLGYSVDWTLAVKYRVNLGSSHTPVYEAEKVTKRNTAKFANVFGALNETVKLNVEEILKDPAFIAAIK